MKSPLLVSLLLVSFYLDASSERTRKTVVKKQKGTALTDQPTALTKETFAKTITANLAVIFIKADWCSWCSKMVPTFQDAAKKFSSQANFGFVDLGSNFNNPAPLLKTIEDKYSLTIRTIPAFLIFKKGKLVDHAVGTQTQEQFAALIKKHGA